MQRVKAWAPAAVWMVVIFMMSAMNGSESAAHSGRIVKLVCWFLELLLGKETAARLPQEWIHLFVRKAAHMTEYAVLFWCYHRALKFEGIHHSGICALMLCACYAATDEWHQSFTEDRGPSPVDVGIDTIGAALALGMHRFYHRMGRRIRKSA